MIQEGLVARWNHDIFSVDPEVVTGDLPTAEDAHLVHKPADCALQTSLLSLEAVELPVDLVCEILDINAHVKLILLEERDVRPEQVHVALLILQSRDVSPHIAQELHQLGKCPSRDTPVALFPIHLHEGAFPEYLSCS